MASILDNPMAMAGLAVMGGQDLSTALVSAAQASYQNKVQQMQMQDYERQQQARAALPGILKGMGTEQALQLGSLIESGVDPRDAVSLYGAMNPQPDFFYEMVTGPGGIPAVAVVNKANPMQRGMVPLDQAAYSGLGMGQLVTEPQAAQPAMAEPMQPAPLAQPLPTVKKEKVPELRRPRMEYEKYSSEIQALEAQDRELANRAANSMLYPEQAKQIEAQREQIANKVERFQKRADEALKTEEKYKALVSAYRDRESQNQIVLDAIDRALPQISGVTTGLLGAAASYVPGSSAVDLEKDLSIIKSNLGVDKLIQMKESSPTGASGFGALSESEMKLLLANKESIGADQSPKRLGESLLRVRDILLKERKQHKKAFKEYMGEIPETGEPANKNASSPLIRSQEEYDALPSGATYMEDDGKVYRKP